jgi:uncharacterized protein (DUF58 family)
MDLGLGLLGAIALLLATPGLAVAALIALLVLVLCALSFLLERRRRVRAERSVGELPGPSAGSPARPRASVARQRRRSSP